MALRLRISRALQPISPAPTPFLAPLSSTPFSASRSGHSRRRIAPSVCACSRRPNARFSPSTWARTRVRPWLPVEDISSPKLVGTACTAPSLTRSMPQARASAATEASAAPSSNYAEFVEFAHQLADEARVIIPKYFRKPISIESKSDESPVTIADREVERAVRSLISSKFPDHSILGEEEGAHTGEGGSAGGIPDYLWVVDPIDGTASFITGKPLFGFLIALLHKGVPVLGILDQPILRERWVGVQGQQTTLNGSAVMSRRGVNLAQSYVYTTSPHLFATAGSSSAFERVRVGARRINYGCDCYAFGLVALGFVDVALEHGVKPWDYMALVPIVKGAGGEATGYQGKELRLDSLEPATWPGTIVASGSLSLQQEVLGVLDWSETA